jgi:hypothetical protein
VPGVVGHPVEHPLRPGSDRQHARGVVPEDPDLARKEREHRELPDLALDVRARVALGQDRGDLVQELGVVEVGDVAELRVMAREHRRAAR